MSTALAILSSIVLMIPKLIKSIELVSNWFTKRSEARRKLNQEAYDALRVFLQEFFANDTACSSCIDKLAAFLNQNQFALPKRYRSYINKYILTAWRYIGLTRTNKSLWCIVISEHNQGQFQTSNQKQFFENQRKISEIEIWFSEKLLKPQLRTEVEGCGQNRLCPPILIYKAGLIGLALP